MSNGTLPPSNAPINQQLDVFIAALARTNLIAAMAVPLVRMFVGALRSRKTDVPDLTEAQVTAKIEESRRAWTANVDKAEGWLEDHPEPDKPPII